jgi:hypothetical protein
MLFFVLRFDSSHPRIVSVCMPSLVDCALRSQKVTDKLLPATAAGDLVTHIGMTLGEATELKLAASSAMPLSSAGGGTAAAVTTVTGGVGSKLLGSPKPLVTSVVSAARCPKESAPMCRARSRFLQLPVAGGGRVLASSNFKQLYEATEAPQFQDQVSAVAHCIFQLLLLITPSAVSIAQAAAGCVLRIARSS